MATATQQPAVTTQPTMFMVTYMVTLLGYGCRYGYIAYKQIISFQKDIIIMCIESFIHTSQNDLYMRI